MESEELMAIYNDILATPAEYIEGLYLEGPKGGCASYVAETAVRAGCLVAYGTDIGTTRTQVIPIPAVPALDVDAIATVAQVASAVAAQILETAVELDGIIGLDRIYPARNITIDTDADVGWDGPLGYTPFWIYGEDVDGHPQTEQLIRNNVGAVAQNIVGFLPFSRVSRVDIGASNAATGVGSIGVSSAYVGFGKLDHPGVVCYDVAREPSATAAVTFDANETLSCCHGGRICVVAQDAVDPGDPVFVRLVAGGGIAAGSFYGEQALTAGANFVRLAGARWRTETAALAVGVIEIGGF